uniref:SRPBCC domain-containing protein n=1 Tax=Janibacter limosus TaxID=53458 RepID=A0AC61U436_9MICO|nr:SRPBCC domain-containing protein [Janibacter limosus]
MWADPRQLEQWWGPETYPATVTEHDLTPGGFVKYHMTSPEGEKFPGGWEVIAVDAPHRLELRDFFADADGNPRGVRAGKPDGHRDHRDRHRRPDGQHLDVGVRRGHAEGPRHGRRRGLHLCSEPARRAAGRLMTMTTTYTVDIFTSLDGFGSVSGGGWGGYWGKQGPELLAHRLAQQEADQRMVFGATTFREFVAMRSD